jgi:MFS family permease
MGGGWGRGHEAAKKSYHLPPDHDIMCTLFNHSRRYIIMLQTFKQLPRNLWITFFAIIGNSFGWSITAYMALFLHLHRGMSVTQIGTVMTGFGVGALVGAYISGHLTDRYPPHRICLITLVINALTVLTIPYLHTYIIMAAVTTLMGTANSAFSPANRVYIMNSCPEKLRAQVTNIRYTVINIGVGSGIFLCGWLSQFNVILPFFFNSTIMLLAALFLYANGDFVRANNNAASTANALSAELMHKTAVFFWLNLSFAFLMQAAFAQLRVTFPLYLYQFYHITQVSLSHLFLLNCLLIIALQIPLSIMLARFNTYIVAGFGSLTIGFGFVLLIFSHQYWWAVISTAIWTLGEMVYFPLSQLLVYDLAPAHRKGWSMGLYQLTYAAANMAGPAIGSLLLAHGHPHWIWFLSGIFGTVTMLGLWICRFRFSLSAPVAAA